MHKWSEVLPGGISKCLKEYFDSRSLWAPMYDPRFPNQNQAKRCFVNYVDYKRCQKIKGEDHRDCDYFKKVSGNVCPAAWIEKWEEQLETGSFPVDI
jgi:cytochrome c oxidase subunit 6b